MKTFAALSLFIAGSVAGIVYWQLTDESSSAGNAQDPNPPAQKEADPPAKKPQQPGSTTKLEPITVAQAKTDPAEPVKTTDGDFTFTADKLGRHLKEYLPPELSSIRPVVRRPLALPGPKFLEKPELAVPKFEGTSIRPALPERGQARPVNPREEFPLAKFGLTPELPEAVEFPEAPLSVQSSPNANAPAPLPILAQPNRDRASLADPSQEASQVAALAAPIPPRTQPVPFTPMNLPNPFEHHGPARLRTPPPEDPMPPLIIARTPGK